MATTKGSDLKSMLGQLDSLLEEYLVKKAPALPTNVKEFLVKFAPWMAVIGVVISVPAILALLGLSAFVVPLGFLGGALTGRPFMGVGYILSVAFLVVMVILEAMSISGLSKRSMGGWRLAYYSVLLSGVQNLVSFNLGGLVIGTLLGLYFLYQIKSHYK